MNKQTSKLQQNKKLKLKLNRNKKQNKNKQKTKHSTLSEDCQFPVDNVSLKLIIPDFSDMLSITVIFKWKRLSYSFMS